MESISMHHENNKPKLRNLILTASIFSLFVMDPNQIKAQSLDNQQGTEYYKDPLMLFNLPQKNIKTEFPGRENYFLSLIHPHNNKKITENKQIEHKVQVSPLSFTKRNIHKYFPEREACFKEIISKIEEDQALTDEINAILSKTIMKPRMVHKETNRRPRTEKDMTGANMIFIEGIVGSKSFSDDLDKKDKLDVLETDTITYDTRLQISDHSQIAWEMIQPALDAVEMFLNKHKQDIIPQQESDNTEIANK